MVWTVNAWFHVETTPSVSVTVQALDPLIGAAEAATPVNKIVFAPLTTAVAEGSLKVTTRALTTPPELVTPSAAKGVIVSVEV